MNECFYENGLKFECTQCSKCCRFDPGYVFLSYNDMARLIKFFKMPENKFIETYCRKVDMGEKSRLSLIEKDNYDCIFWSNGRCEIYEVRPLQCRSYPFWKPFLESKKAWDEESVSCPGMNHGLHVSKEKIEDWIKKRESEKYILL